SDIITVKGFQNRFPVTDYDIYFPLIRLQTNIGESEILTEETVTSYAITSGTIGSIKRLPMTARQQKPLVSAFSELVKNRVSFLLFESLPRIKKHNDNTYSNSITGLVLSAYLDKHVSRGVDDPGIFTSPRPLLQPGEVADLTYVRLLFALIRRDVDQIISPFTWGVLDAFRYLERHHKEITQSIRQGKILYEHSIPKPLLYKLEGSLSPDPERADELEGIFKDGFNEKTVSRIWPKLERIIAAGTGTFRIYTDQMKQYAAGIEHINGFYASSEALIGVETDVTGEYLLSTKNAFVEFVPVGEKEAAPVSAFETEPGRQYTLLLTTFAGLYRYRLDDVVTIRRFEGELPVFTFDCRLSDRIVTKSGILTDNEIYDALKELMEKTGTAIRDYAYLLSDEDRKLVIYAEPSGKEESILPADEETRALFEELLQEKSAGYASAKKAGDISGVIFNYVEPETQLLYRDIRRFRIRCSPDQIKPIRVVFNPNAEDYLNRRIIRG
nr:GH3 auxin-responsive promoter family protein [Lachnospiraceae bacterium]